MGFRKGKRRNKGGEPISRRSRIESYRAASGTLREKTYYVWRDRLTRMTCVYPEGMASADFGRREGEKMSGMGK